MNISVNGKLQTFPNASISVLDLLKINKVESIEMVSVQVNGNFVDKKNFESIVLNENDELDFLYFMGGGEK
jgi:sulfur carrier protein